MKRLDRYRYVVINGAFVVLAWAAVACGGIALTAFAAMVLFSLCVELVLVGLAYRRRLEARMADKMLRQLPVPLWCELVFDVAFTAWLVWLGHGLVTVAAYGLTSVISGGMLVGAWARSVEAKTWGGEK